MSSPSNPEIASRLLQIKAIQLRPTNPFTWASGLKSPIYCDNRLLLSFPMVRNEVINAMAIASQEFGKPDVIAGVATAGIAHGALLANALDLPFIYVRDKAKGHGRENRIEGKVEGGENVLVVEDLISTGGSSIKAVQALKDSGCKVLGVLAIFSYELGVAENNFKAEQTPYSSITGYSEMLEEALRMGAINEHDMNILREWKSDPIHWFTNHFPETHIAET